MLPSGTFLLAHMDWNKVAEYDGLAQLSPALRGDAGQEDRVGIAPVVGA
jgi:hypothetical protein